MVNLHKHGYMKEGKGVRKRDSNEFGISLFFELYFRKLGRLMKLNILYVIACIPTFLVFFVIAGLISSRITNASAPIIASVLGNASPDTSNPEFAGMVAMFDIVIRVVIAFVVTVLWGMGPVTAGYTYILRNYAREEHAWLLSDFFEKAKQNFGQALVVWIVDLVFFAITTVAFMFYMSQQGATRYLSYVTASVMLVYTVMHFYIYPCMVTFKLKIKDLFKNALIFALAEAPVNLLILFVLLIIHLGIPYAALQLNLSGVFWLIFALLELLILVATSGFIVNFWVYPIIKKYTHGAEEKETTEDKIDDIQGLL